jgi:hypothetical protein
MPNILAKLGPVLSYYTKHPALAAGSEAAYILDKKNILKLISPRRFELLQIPHQETILPLN